MATNTNNLYNREFRQKIINLDKGSLAELVGTLAGDIEVKVLKNTKETYHVIIPTNSSTIDLDILGNIQAAANTAASSFATIGTVCSTFSCASSVSLPS